MDTNEVIVNEEVVETAAKATGSGKGIIVLVGVVALAAIGYVGYRVTKAIKAKHKANQVESEVVDNIDVPVKDVN